MKKLLAFMLTVLYLALCLGGCVPIQDSSEMRVIGVVAKGEDSPFWKAVLAGAEDAATDNGYQITFRGPASEQPSEISSQREMIRLALDNDCVGLVLATIGSGFDDLLEEAYDRGIPVIQFDTGIWPVDIAALKSKRKRPFVASITTGNEKAGAVAAEHLFAEIREDIVSANGVYKLGIIQHDLSYAGEDRSKGFMEKFRELADADLSTVGKYEILRETRVGEAHHAYARAMEMLYAKGAKAVFMTNENVVNQVSELIDESQGEYDHMCFVGFDGGNRQLNWLRASSGPRLIGSVTQDAYQIGYQAVQQCVNALEARGVTAFVMLPGAWYDMENLDAMLARNMIEEG